MELTVNRFLQSFYHEYYDHFTVNISAVNPPRSEEEFQELTWENDEVGAAKAVAHGICS